VAHVVCEPCALCEKERREAPCVLACPENAFLTSSVVGGGKVVAMNVIDPIACTDCKACIPACPSRAIFHEDVVPDEWMPYILLNYLQSTEPTSVRITRRLSS
jgi:Fe-S-cluster-containing hydrogenase component 2